MIVENLHVSMKNRSERKGTRKSGKTFLWLKVREKAGKSCRTNNNNTSLPYCSSEVVFLLESEETQAYTPSSAASQHEIPLWQAYSERVSYSVKKFTRHVNIAESVLSPTTFKSNIFNPIAHPFHKSLRAKVIYFHIYVYPNAHPFHNTLRVKIIACRF